MIIKTAFQRLPSHFLLSAALLCLSCSQKSPNEASQKPSFCAIVQCSSFYTDYSTMHTIQMENISVYAQVLSDPISDFVGVTLNGKPPEMLDDHSAWLTFAAYKQACAVFINEDFTGEKEIAITSDMGNATGSISIPESLAYVGHNNIDIIPKYNDVLIQWHCNANYYAVVVELLLTDSLHSRLKIADTTVTDTFYQIPARFINDSIGGLIMYVLAYNGPYPQSTMQPNMQGAGPGYMWAINSIASDDSRYLILYTSMTFAKKAAITNYEFSSPKEILNLLISDKNRMAVH